MLFDVEFVRRRKRKRNAKRKRKRWRHEEKLSWHKQRERTEEE
jgi:hypothetical protein